jgi:hypothetical protein
MEEGDCLDVFDHCVAVVVAVADVRVLMMMLGSVYWVRRREATER